MTINLQDWKTEYPCLKNVFFVFIGQNATTGEPHPLTGRLNTWGRYQAFTTRTARDEFADSYYNPGNPQEFCKACSVTSGRKYSLGMSIHDYLEMLASAVTEVELYAENTDE